jgi:bacteriocin-like protein
LKPTKGQFHDTTRQVDTGNKDQELNIEDLNKVSGGAAVIRNADENPMQQVNPPPPAPIRPTGV